MHVKWKEKYEKEKENAIQHLCIYSCKCDKKTLSPNLNDI